MVKILYRLKRVRNKPMTVVMEQLLLQSLATVDKEQVYALRKITTTAKDVISINLSHKVTSRTPEYERCPEAR
ncbi:MAG: hypothetical protein ABH844_07235 [Candidatus Omnitrophota bacterium]